MKSKNEKAAGRMVLCSLATVLITMALFLSCKKEASATPVAATSNDNMYNIAEIIQGKVFAGTISSNNDDSTLNINYNNGSQFVMVQNLPGQLKVNMPTLPSAELITSVYGVIIKDDATGKMVLLANNDAESIQKFEAVKAALKGRYTSTTTYGITVVHAEGTTPAQPSGGI